MNAQLMYVGITHETAQVQERTYYALSKEQKQAFAYLLTHQLGLKAFAIITTCNRTEVYFESDSVTPYEVRSLLIEYVATLHKVKLATRAFLIFDSTIDTARHLLSVANGLKSAVIGDKQIIQQVKASYQQALTQSQQGSLLERAFQAVFRSHKRVSKESLYRQGSTSTAYSALKMIEAHFGKGMCAHLKVLIVGAGEIAEDLLRYVPKFGFAYVAVSNRTAEKATHLAQQYQIGTYAWQQVVANQLDGFDVVITAVSNRKHLISQPAQTARAMLWIDLAMPSNIDAAIANNLNKVYNIDEVASQVHATNETQLKALPVVEKIIEEELEGFIGWLKKGKMRVLLKSYKNYIKDTFLQTAAPEASALTEDIEQAANRWVRKSARAIFQPTSHQQ